jgi:ribonucleoside-diphosphate reductase alpha chain
VRQVQARDLYGKMMRTLAQTGNGWMTFKDASNAKCNQTGAAGNVVHLSNLCTEITEVTTDAETAVCNLGSVNLARHLTTGRGETPAGVDWDKLRATVRTAVPFLDRVIDLTFYPSEQAAASNPRWRPVGLGVMGLQDVFFALRLPFDSPRGARAVGADLRGDLPDRARGLGRPGRASTGRTRRSPDPRRRRAAPARPVGRRGDPAERWARCASGSPDRAAQLAADRDRPDRHDRLDRRVLRVHRAAGVEPVQARDHVRRVPPGQHRAGGRAQGTHGLWTPEVREAIKRAEGSVQGVTGAARGDPALFRTAWELPQRALIDLAAARAPFIDQSQSLNLFMAAPTIGKLSSMYMHAWKSGLKTTYYLRSRPATRIQQATVAVAGRAGPAGAPRGRPIETADQAAIACSLENPETCEACQ